MEPLRVSDLYNAGYAIPVYDIREHLRMWRYRETETSIPAQAVATRELPGVQYSLALIADITNYRKDKSWPGH